MSKIVKARISPCPECGENDWWMELEPGVELAPEARLRRDVARRMFDEARDIQRNRGIVGFFSRRVRRASGQESVPYEDPSPDHIRCANCGHEVSLAQSRDQADTHRDWPIG